MNSQGTIKHFISEKRWRYLAIIVLVLGIFFRFVNIEQKAYWYDETFTSLQLSGYNGKEVMAEVLDGAVVGSKDLEKYQYPSNSEKTVIDTIQGVATIEPQLTPLYFVIARYWAQWAGHSVTLIRSLSAVFGLLVLPCAYWLCWELFRLPSMGWLAVMLMAVSPFHLLYAQEARPYSLWTVAILFSSTLFLRAMRLQTRASWIIYGLSVTLGLYSFLISILVYLGHGIYVLITEKFRFTKKLVAYLISSIAGFLAFLPWMYFVVTILPKIESSPGNFRSETLPLHLYIIKWIRSISLFFADFNLSEESQLIYLVPFGVVLLLLLGLVAYSIYFIAFHGTEKARLFVLALIFTTAIALMLLDLIAGGSRSIVTRYMIPCFLGIQLAVAYVLAKNLDSHKLWQQRFWQVTTVALISIGILSCVSYTNSEVWWTKADDNAHIEIARIINQTERPLLVSDVWVVKVISLNHKLDEKVRFQLVSEGNIPKIAQGFSDVFLFSPSETLLAGLKKNYGIEPVSEPWLWKLK